MVWHTVAGCLRYRVTGLAAEVAFFALLSLPPLVFGLVGSIGFIARRFTVTEQGEFRHQVLIYANRFLTPDTVDDIIAPTLDEVLLTSRFEIVSIGFVIALWSGSRAMAVFVDAITIMYGLRGERGILKTRALSFGVYLGFMVGGAIILPVVVAGPRLVDQLLPDSLELLARLYWPIVLLASVAVLASLLHWATPVRNRWRSHVPGAALTVLVWIVGSAGLRLVLLAMTGSTSIFGPLATPIALILWLYLIAIAVLVGGALNAAVAKEWPRFAGISPAEADHVLDALDEDDQLDNNGVKDSPERQ